MRRFVFYAIMGLFGLIVASCGQPKKDSGVTESRSLYEKSVALMHRYTDSLRIVKDSASVHRLSLNFDEELTKLNFNYPPDTDLGISEGENDTLSNLNRRFVELRDSLLYRIAHPVLPTDSTSPIDSIQK